MLKPTALKRILRQDANLLLSIIEKMLQNQKYSLYKEDSLFPYFKNAYNKHGNKIITMLNKRLKKYHWEIYFLWDDVSTDDILVEIKVIEKERKFWQIWN